MKFNHILSYFRASITVFVGLIVAPGFLNGNAAAQSPGVDLMFNASLTKVVTSDFTGSPVLQTDGKILVFGTFQAGGTYLNRLNTDGTPDTSFDGSITNTANVYSVLALPDGKIIVAGFTDIPKVYRLNSDGSLDPTFNSNLYYEGANFFEIKVEAAQPDGKIIIRLGYSISPGTVQEIFRLKTDGTRDSSFTANGYGPFRLSRASYSRILVLPDGKLLIGGTVTSAFSWSGFIYRANADGTTDTTFERPTFTDTDNRSSVGQFDVFPDGSIIVPGKFTSVNSISKTDLVRLHPAGNVDLNFSPDTLFDAVDTTGGKASVLSNGQFLVSTIIFNAGIPAPLDNKLFRFNSNGSLDNTYNQPVGLTYISNWILDAANRALIFGTLSGNSRYLRLNADATLDAGFNPTITKRGTVAALAVQTDGKILLGGDFNRIGGTVKNNFGRVNSDGAVDASFDSGTGFDITPKILALQTDGKILAGGDFTMYNGVAKTRIARLNSDGNLDSLFNTDLSSSVYSIVPLANGKILIGGNFSTVNGIAQAGLARLNADGSLDTLFTPIFGSATIFSVLVQADGKIMVAGSFSGVNGFSRQNLVRLNSDGTLDATFNAGSIFSVDKVFRQSGGKYVIMQHPNISRRNSDGSADASFQAPAINGTVNVILLQTDDSILVGGAFSLPKPNLTRFLPNGALDSGFIPAGANTTVHAIAAQADGKTLVGGNFVTIGGVARSGVARIATSAFQARTNFDYDGDGKADVSVFRPSENKWYVLRSSDFGVTQQVFAIAGDVPVPADYDGDGKTDFAIFRPSSGDWWSLSSINGAQVFAHWGTNGDIPRPSDFDGDGRADFVVFRPSNSFWYRISSASGAASNQGFGLTGDKAVTGDFDGDGKSDKAIYRPSTGDWWWQSSVDNAQRATHWGISTDIPAPADYDGDGKTDFAVYRPSTGVWYIYNSGTLTSTIINFGLAEDKPVAADYDGDGKADIAVFRPSTGVWYLLQSTAGFSAIQFGISTDIPTQNAFVP